MQKYLLDLPVTRLKATALHEPRMHIDSISHLHPGVPSETEHLLKRNKAIITNASH